jgi:hypothetical protein
LIINNTFGFIFVHVPKAAGTTLTALLSKCSTYCDIEVGGTVLGEAIQPHFRQRYGLAKHSTAREISAVVGEVFWKRYFSFAFVRNPYARAYSSYRFLRRMRTERALESLDVIERLPTFEDFVRSDYFDSEGLDRILMPQLFWLRRGPADAAIRVDFVGKVEEMAASLEEIARQVEAVRRHLQSETTIPTLNKSDANGSSWQDSLADRSIETRIFTRYQADFAAFGYERWPQP